jgi:hypothetical protein
MKGKEDEEGQRGGETGRWGDNSDIYDAAHLAVASPHLLVSLSFRPSSISLPRRFVKNHAERDRDIKAFDWLAHWDSDALVRFARFLKRKPARLRAYDDCARDCPVDLRVRDVG